ncbi:hypothetical protein [Christiangramia sediminis]|uniref:Uncharacterized protein n=1 Tax=Christiangramia sediminis TaxID=2881336 RepID=A0A9X1LHY4_9FLAO|nr:hypothetical protein [Christiangramia sediminis]MCB7480654.1 hypothetical protein [Christiangramia sediminis]
MKIINKYLAIVAIVALLFTSCSKDETSPVASDDPEATSVDLSFGALLNDLANRGMNKAHFDQIPDCSEGEPAVAVVDFSYGGSDYTAVVDILEDENGYFTDYSEVLKIPVANNSSVTVTLNGFMVYDGDPEGDGDLIWIAPKRTEGAPLDQFDGYVDRSLPFDFEVEDGTKPYISVEVLCFDRRMVNEYGYVFFDILPETIYPLCLFVNYCDENGRHYVADYSVDLYFGTDDTGIQLYDHEDDASAMATTGDYGDGEYYADPLCLVIPGPPANLDDDEPYLYLIVYPQDWDGTGNIDNTPVPVLLTWEAVEELLNSDGSTNEYLHLLVGECEDALEGDETIGGGGNGSGCNPSNPEADCDDDDTLNKCDTDNPNYAGFDCDGDDIPNGQEASGCVNNPSPDCGTVEPTACDLTISDPSTGCFRAIVLDQTASSYAEVNQNTGIPIVDASQPLIDAATFGITLTGAGIEYNWNSGSATVPEYLVEIKDSENGDVFCVDQNDPNSTVEGTFTYPIYIRVTGNVCTPQ